MSTSQNGWPAIASSSSPLLYTWLVPLDADRRSVIKLRMHRGSAGFCLAHLAMCWDGKIDPLDTPHPADDWAWAFRPVRGYSNTLSNHSSGTAIDLDATEHPLGRDTFDAEDTATMHRLLARYDDVLRWGGDYHGRLDQMHVELNDDVTMAQVEKVARRLMGTKRGERLLVANPTQKKVILS